MDNGSNGMEWNKDGMEKGRDPQGWRQKPSGVGRLGIADYYKLENIQQIRICGESLQR